MPGTHSEIGPSAGLGDALDHVEGTVVDAGERVEILTRDVTAAVFAGSTVILDYPVRGSHLDLLPGARLSRRE